MSTPPARYKNPWHDPKNKNYGPEYFTASVKPIEHCGALIYRVHDKQHDVVKAGLCITQVVGLAYAKECAELVQHYDAPTPKDLRFERFKAPCQACGKITAEQEYSGRAGGYVDLCNDNCLTEYERKLVLKKKKATA